ncbi:hypothetical protein VMCG_05375 [Cytospora schulzeri]|uniref:Uncharacterized protein n=1 Tax=Cytospora schulzeri TaxID=448051 RepID=A0A423WJY1_9PEZI|nr:hypothetical protein VMCG_05375 [Valsa malicola]
MPYLGSDTCLPEALVPVNLMKKIRNRFYEPIILLYALTQFCMHNNALKILEQAPDVALQTSEQLFHDFMNKLAQICDNDRGGRTVTAAVALQYSDCVEYRFASNQRDEDELQNLKAFIEGILNSLKTLTAENSAMVRVRLLQRIVIFNRPRLQIYVREIRTQSQKCLESPADAITPQTKERLENLRDLSLKADDRDVDDNAFFRNCTDLTVLVKRLSKSETYTFLRDKANKNGQVSPWGVLRHAAGRLLSYFQVIKTLIEARKQWERLFYDFKVVCLPSSSELHNPISRKDVTPKDIIGRMTSDAGKAESYNQIVQKLEQFDVEGRVRSQARNSNYRLTVHAELLIHQSITNDPDVKSLHPSKFFENNKYIGCSKPTCRLCHYYFAACADGIQIRQTHKNLYTNWKVPDVYKDQGEEAVKRRDGIINKMIVPIREDTFSTLRDKVAESKRFDTNTDPTYMAATSLGYTDVGIEDFSESLRLLSLDDAETSDHASPQDGQEGSTGPNEKDDDEGGVKLSEV